MVEQQRPDADAPAGVAIAARLAEYARRSATGDPRAARDQLIDALAARPETDWLACGQNLVLRRDLASAVAVFCAAVREHPESVDLGYACAGVLWQAGQPAQAEALLRALLARQPEHAAATFLLAKLLKEQARMHAAETVVRALFRTEQQGVDTVIQAVELLDDCGRKRAAADLCEDVIATGSPDPRLHAYAGMLNMQVGRFEVARERYLFAFEHDARASEWQAANGLSSLQRYADATHPDFALFERCLQRDDLSPRARASLLFALGKACDDVADTARASACFREGNALVAGFTRWSRKDWRRRIAARLDGNVLPRIATADDSRIPVFILGMPRSGSTLLAERLARHPQVCDRGELAWLPFLADRIGAAGRPDQGLMHRCAAEYLTQLAQDDSDARWFIDKQPMNFLHVDLIRALFPEARIIRCERGQRDTALSIWMQYFAGTEENFAYDFADIAAVMQGCTRLLARADKESGPAMRKVRYEDLVTDPQAGIDAIANWLGLPEADLAAAPAMDTAISTSSLWQARQPVYTRSVGRWRAYAEHVPELMRFPA